MKLNIFKVINEAPKQQEFQISNQQKNSDVLQNDCYGANVIAIPYSKIETDIDNSYK